MDDARSCGRARVPAGTLRMATYARMLRRTVEVPMRRAQLMAEEFIRGRGWVLWPLTISLALGASALIGMLADRFR